MYSVFLIDDDIWALEDIRETFCFERYGFQITGEFKSGEEALSAARQSAPDLMVSDICMGGFSGLELAAVCKKEFPGTRVILVSGHERFDYAQEALKHGVFSYLLKPLLDSEVEDTMQRLMNELSSEEASPFPDDLVGRAMNYIEKHYDTSMPLEDVAGFLFVNKNYLSEQFSKRLGVTFTAYKNSVRIRHAKEFIRQGKMSMAEIAQATGFDSSSRFSKVFHQLTGVTPQQYQKNLPPA